MHAGIVHSPYQFTQTHLVCFFQEMGAWTLHRLNPWRQPKFKAPSVFGSNLLIGLNYWSLVELYSSRSSREESLQNDSETQLCKLLIYSKLIWTKLSLGNPTNPSNTWSYVDSALLAAFCRRAIVADAEILPIKYLKFFINIFTDWTLSEKNDTAWPKEMKTQEVFLLPIIFISL